MDHDKTPEYSNKYAHTRPPGRGRDRSGRVFAVALALLLLASVGGWLVTRPLVPRDSAAGVGLMANSGAGALPVSANAAGNNVSSQLTTYPNGVTAGKSYKNDLSPRLRDMKPVPVPLKPQHAENENPGYLTPGHVDMLDKVVQRTFGTLAGSLMPAPSLNFDGIPFPGVSCNCAPPDTDGEVGATQYVQMVNEGYQVFNKTTGASVLGPNSIVSLWSGFGGVCETSGHGDPVVLYDQIANRWVLSQFAG